MHIVRLFQLCFCLAAISWLLTVVAIIAGDWSWPLALFAAIAFSIYTRMTIPLRFEVEEFFARRKSSK